MRSALAARNRRRSQPNAGRVSWFHEECHARTRAQACTCELVRCVRSPSWGGMARTSALATSAKGGSRAKSLEQRPCTRTATFGTGIGGLHLLDDIAHTDWPDWIYRTDRPAQCIQAKRQIVRGRTPLEPVVRKRARVDCDDGDFDDVQRGSRPEARRLQVVQAHPRASAGCVVRRRRPRAHRGLGEAKPQLQRTRMYATLLRYMPRGMLCHDTAQVVCKGLFGLFGDATFVNCTALLRRTSGSKCGGTIQQRWALHHLRWYTESSAGVRATSKSLLYFGPSALIPRQSTASAFMCAVRCI